MTGSTGHILVVDDNQINRMMLTRALAEQGHTSETAGDGRAALEMLAGGAFDVVLLDILMPEMDGYETLARLKDDPALRHLPVIVISAVDEMESVIRCIEMGAADYLPKPFNAALLRARITAALAEKRLRDYEAAEARKLEAQLKLAAKAQQSLIPARLPEIAGFQFAAKFEPAQAVGGDFYDVVALENGQAAIWLGDVSDKGMHAALFMAMIRALTLRELPTAIEPVEIALAVHHGLKEATAANMFVTAIYGFLDPASRVFRYVRAGHDYPLWVSASGHVEMVQGIGQVLGGLVAVPKLEACQLTLNPGDSLVFYSDGVTDMRDPQGAGFGVERLIEVAVAARAEGAQAMAQAIYEAVRDHRAGTPAFDDFSLLIVTAEGSEEQPAICG